MELPGDVGHIESHFGLLEIVLVLVQDRSIVCARRPIASENLFARTRWYS
jgi:hypothetical protein